MKKALSLISIALVIIAIGIASYYYFVFDTIDPQTGEKQSFREFLPFGSSGTVVQNENDTDGQEPDDFGATDTEDEFGEPAVFKMISDAPVSGNVIFGSGTSTIVRYSDKATGNIYDYDTASGQTARITNTTVPKVREAVWNPNGASAIFRYVKAGSESIESYFIGLKSSTTTDGFRETDGVFLAPNISEMTMLGSNSLFYLIKGQEGTAGYLSTAQGKNPVAVFSSPANEWNAEFVSGDRVLLETKPSSYVPGYAYLLNTRTKSFEKVLGGKMGLTALMDPTGSHLLFAENENGFKLKVYDTASGVTTPVNLSTIAEKCVWKRDGSFAFCGVPKTPANADYIDLWHQGVITSSDDIWIINPAGGYANIYISPEIEANASIDVTDLALSPDQKWLTFIDKKSSKLWLLELGED